LSRRARAYDAGSARRSVSSPTRPRGSSTHGYTP
jgi:hypothetical protein